MVDIGDVESAEPISVTSASSTVGMITFNVVFGVWTMGLNSQ